MMTVYKWNLLLRLFGPYDQFLDNFRNLVLKRGFLGLINRIKVCLLSTLLGSIKPMAYCVEVHVGPGDTFAQ